MFYKIVVDPTCRVLEFREVNGNTLESDIEKIFTGLRPSPYVVLTYEYYARNLSIIKLSRDSFNNFVFLVESDLEIEPMQVLTFEVYPREGRRVEKSIIRGGFVGDSDKSRRVRIL